MKRAIAFALLAGCGSGTPANSMYIAGFDPPAPDPGDLVVVSPVIKDLQPGSNITMCSYLDTKIDDMTDVVGFHGYQSSAGHHALLVTARKPQAPNTHVCTEDDMVNSGTYVGAGGKEGMSNFKGIPAGIAFRIPAGSQLMLQTHWINATTTATDGQAVIYLQTQPASDANVPADQFLVDTETWSIPPQQAGDATTTCKFQQDVSLFMYGGHMHEWGKHISIDKIAADGTAANIYDQDWLGEYASNPPLTFFTKDEPFIVHAGESIRVHCQWMNDTAKPISFPTEMCFFVGYYFPGHGMMDCSEGVWPN